MTDPFEHLELALFRDKEGNAIDVLQWSKLFNDDAYRHVALDDFEVDGERVRVSTVWLGCVASPIGPSGIFRTGVRRGSDDVYQDDGEWSTLAEAEAGHVALVNKLRGVQGSV